jgi:arsenate reductase
MTDTRLRILFLCTGNSARSQMAEAVARHLSGGLIDVESAGTAPQPDIHPMARQAVKSLYGLSMDGQHPKLVGPLVGRHFDYIITVCDRAAETCPVFPGQTERIHWGYADPAAATGSDEDKQRAFDDTARNLAARIRLWLALPVVNNRLAPQS